METDTAPGSSGRLTEGLPERRFRPELHGLRGLAILLVALFHVFGHGRVSGGLDVFLVVSGFLFTGMLLREAATTGRIGRILGVLAMWAGALGLVALVADVVLDPGSALSVRAAALSGITGEVGTTGHRLTWTPWAALAVGALALLAAAAATLGLQSWSGLSSRYDSPTTVTAGARGERVGTDWDRLSAGEDPTLGPDDAPHEPRS